MRRTNKISGRNLESTSISETRNSPISDLPSIHTEGIDKASLEQMPRAEAAEKIGANVFKKQLNRSPDSCKGFVNMFRGVV